MLSGTCCAVTPSVARASYWSGNSFATRAVTAPTTAMGTSSSHTRRLRMSTMSSGVNIFPGSIGPPFIYV